jgi:hypothetical protein
MHFLSEPLHHHRAAVVENARPAHHVWVGSSVAAPPRGEMGIHAVSSPQISGQLLATAANDA